MDELFKLCIANNVRMAAAQKKQILCNIKVKNTRKVMVRTEKKNEVEMMS